MSVELKTTISQLSSRDAELFTRIGIALALRQRAALRRIQIAVVDGCITLRGEMPSFFDKQLAIESTRRVAGVIQVKDELSVLAFEIDNDSPTFAEKRRSTESVHDGAGTTNQQHERDSSMPRFATSPVVATVTFVRTATAVLLFLAELFVGCSSEDRLKVYPVEGQITFNGQPLANALVVLHPKDTSNPKLLAARGQTDAAGTFKVSTYDSQDGAPVGSYAVTVEYYQLLDKGNGGFEPGPNVLPPRLASPQTTDIVVEVAANPNKLPPVEVSR